VANKKHTDAQGLLPIVYEAKMMFTKELKKGRALFVWLLGQIERGLF
jgi:hypothetical protein